MRQTVYHHATAARNEREPHKTSSRFLWNEIPNLKTESLAALGHTVCDSQPEVYAQWVHLLKRRCPYRIQLQPQARTLSVEPAASNHHVFDGSNQVNNRHVFYESNKFIPLHLLKANLFHFRQNSWKTKPRMTLPQKGGWCSGRRT